MTDSNQCTPIVREIFLRRTIKPLSFWSRPILKLDAGLHNRDAVTGSALQVMQRVAIPARPDQISRPSCGMFGRPWISRGPSEM